jgi:hypothetical protein
MTLFIFGRKIPIVLTPRLGFVMHLESLYYQLRLTLQYL